MNDEKPSPFADLLSGLVWLALAAGIIALSWRMDRLEHLQASPYSVPGLVPGILGAALGLMALILIGRSLGRGAFAARPLAAPSLLAHRRLLLTLALCLTYAAGVVGSGVPFWLATGVFVAVFVFLFHEPGASALRRPRDRALFAAFYALAAGAATHFALRDLFPAPPLWLGAGVAAAVFAFLFREPRGPAARGPLYRAAFAMLHGLVAGAAIHFVFQDLFLVRLP